MNGAIFYENKKTTLQSWDKTLHIQQPRGLAYKQGDYLIHIYGKAERLWVISPGLTASQKTEMNVQDWAIQVFGAEEILPAKNLPGEVTSGVWRPGLYFQSELQQALNINEHDQRAAEQILKILLDKLDELFLYIEPDQMGLNAYSHKTRELLLLACTEIENAWRQYMYLANLSPSRKDYTTNDYVKLCQPLFLSQYEVKLKPYKDVQSIMPFYDWSPTKPTESLSWYDSYNKTKHDRTEYFGEATLWNCIQAITANIVLFCVRYSPFSLFQSGTTLSALMNQLFEVNLISPNPATFYIPKVKFSDKDRPAGLVCGEAKQFIVPWKINPLKL